MPELSRFFGIVIRMLVEVGGQHHRAHFHAFYQEHTAVFTIDTVECLGGDLPKAQRRLVEAWVEIHREELPEGLGLVAIGPAARQDRATQVSAMVHAIHRVTRFEIVGPYTLAVSFVDGSEQMIDFQPASWRALWA